MSVYILATYDVVDPEAYKNYVAGVIPLLMKHKAEVLVADYEPNNIEGEARGANIVLKFESEEAAMNWYNDPDYESVKKIRFDNTTNGYLALSKQFVPPNQ